MVIHIEAGQAVAASMVEAVVRALEAEGIRFVEVGGGVGLVVPSEGSSGRGRRLFMASLAVGQGEAEGRTPANLADDTQFAALALHQISA
jgi:hypothetical protein